MGVHITREELEKILKSKIEPIERSLNFTSEEYHGILDRVAILEETNKSLLLENGALKSQLNSVVGKINENTALLDEQEQYIRRECVEIKGIPARRDEVTNDIVLQVAELLDVEMREDDISISHRLPLKKPWTDSNGIKHPPSPPSIIAKFVRRDVKEEFYRARYKLKHFTTKDIDVTFASSEGEGNKIYISESLTQARRKLFNSALKLKKDLKFNYISTSNGRIYLRKNNSKDSPHIQINSESDLAKLRAKEQHPTASIPSRDRGQRHGSEPWLTQALEAQIGLGKESATLSTAKPGIANNRNGDRAGQATSSRNGNMLGQASF